MWGISIRWAKEGGGWEGVLPSPFFVVEAKGTMYICAGHLCLAGSRPNAHEADNFTGLPICGDLRPAQQLQVRAQLSRRAQQPLCTWQISTPRPELVGPTPTLPLLGGPC